MTSSNSHPQRPTRKVLPHAAPAWVPLDATYFLTINCAKRGVNQLAVPDVSIELLKTIVARMEMAQWYPKLVLFMPDHVHGLFVFGEDVIMRKVLESWKRYTARYLRINWQRDFFDHRIRNEASYFEKWDYIITNPIRAGLVNDALEWPYVWRVDDFLEFRSSGLPNRPPTVCKDESQ